MFEKIVKLERIVGIKIVHHGHCIKFHAMFFEQMNAFHNLHKSGLTTFVATILVVKLLRAIDRNTHQKIVFFEKFAPGIVEQSSVGLNYVVNFTSASVFFLKFEGFFVEANRTQQSFATMPGKKYFVLCLRINVLFGEFFEECIAHQLALGRRIEIFLFEIITIFALQIAGRSYRLQHHIHRFCKRCKGFIHFR